jgi:hypothetical protein
MPSTIEQRSGVVVEVVAEAVVVDVEPGWVVGEVIEVVVAVVVVLDVVSLEVVLVELVVVVEDVDVLLVVVGAVHAQGNPVLPVQTIPEGQEP